MKMFMMNINVYDELKMFMMNGKCNDEPKTFIWRTENVYDEPNLDDMPTKWAIHDEATDDVWWNHALTVQMNFI